MKSPQHDESTRSTAKMSDRPLATSIGVADSKADPWCRMIELIAQQLVKAWASESKFKIGSQ
jgi:hypothetical protein